MVYCEGFRGPEDAIRREKQIKRYARDDPRSPLESRYFASLSRRATAARTTAGCSSWMY
jgi:hypothetical protein